MSKVLTKCSGCLTKLRVPEKYLGEEIACPQCEGTFLVKEFTEAAPVATPRPVASPAKKPAPPVPPRGSTPPLPATPGPSRKPAPAKSVVKKAEKASAADYFEDIDEDEEDDYGEPVRTPPKNRGLPPKVIKKKKPARPLDDDDDDRPRSRRSSYSSGVNGGLMIKGLLMSVGAVVWFVVGYMAGFIYFYPPILLVIGLVTMVRGLAGGGGDE